jgi:hypothetical protein
MMKRMFGLGAAWLSHGRHSRHGRRRLRMVFIKLRFTAVIQH